MPANTAEYQKPYTRRYYLKNRERLLTQMRVYDLAHREESAARKRTWYEANKKLVRARQIAKDYGVSEADYWSRFTKQKGRCAICLIRQRKRTLAVDHDHATNKFRGLLCRSCNTALGHFRDSRRLLQRAITYLEESHRE